MTRETLDRKIQHLRDEILVLDSMVQDSLTQSVLALRKQDVQLAHQIYDQDKTINAKRFEIENEVITTIALQQPIMAGDLRLLASILEVAGELERMGDYAKGIAHIVTMIGKEPLIKPLIDIPRMAEISISMLHRAVGAFIAVDAETARKIPDEDDEVDNLYNQVYRELVTIMFANPKAIDQGNYLMWAAHNLERLADRSCRSGGIVKAAAATVGDQVHQLVLGHRPQLSGRELGQQGDAGGAKDVRERLDAVPVTALEEGVGLEAQFLATQLPGELEAIARQPAQALPEVAGHVGDGPLAEAQSGGDVEGIAVVILGATQHQGIFEAGDELGVEADQRQLKGLQDRTGA